MHAYCRRRQYIQMRHNMSLQIMRTRPSNGNQIIFHWFRFDWQAGFHLCTGQFSIYCVYLNRVLKAKLHNLSRIWKSFIKSETTSSQFASSHYVHVLTFLFALNELFVDQSLSPLLSNIHWLTFWRVNISIMRQAYKSSFSS